jgi:hypothetical protein
MGSHRKGFLKLKCLSPLKMLTFEHNHSSTIQLRSSLFLLVFSVAST